MPKPCSGNAVPPEWNATPNEPSMTVVNTVIRLKNVLRLSFLLESFILHALLFLGDIIDRNLEVFSHFLLVDTCDNGYKGIFILGHDVSGLIISGMVGVF